MGMIHISITYVANANTSTVACIGYVDMITPTNQKAILQDDIATAKSVSLFMEYNGRASVVASGKAVIANGVVLALAMGRSS